MKIGDVVYTPSKRKGVITSIKFIDGEAVYRVFVSRMHRTYSFKVGSLMLGKIVLK